jgi:hypothetical protein
MIRSWDHDEFIKKKNYEASILKNLMLKVEIENKL